MHVACIPVDQIVDDPTSVILDDSELTLFKNYLKFRDSDIQHTIDDAIQFFNNTYGLDFSDSPPNEKNECFFQNAKMNPFLFQSPDKSNFLLTDSRWIGFRLVTLTHHAISFMMEDFE